MKRIVFKLFVMSTICICSVEAFAQSNKTQTNTQTTSTSNQKASDDDFMVSPPPRPQKFPRMKTSDMSKDESLKRSRYALSRKIRSELLGLPYYDVFDWLQFQILADNTVVLSGQVSRPTLKSDAENVLEDIEGVAGIKNNIEVLPLSPNDDQIRVAVYREVYSGPNFRYGIGSQQPIHIIVKNGRVTLKGIVSNEAEKNYANIKANGVSGVFEVKNEIFVERSSS